MLTALSLQAIRGGFRKGQPLRARQLESIRQAARVAASVSPSRGGRGFIDRDGAVIESVKSAPVRPEFRVGIVQQVYAYHVTVLEATGELPYPVPLNSTPLAVYVGEEHPLRPAMDGCAADLLFFMEIAPTITNFRYVGFYHLPGFAHAEPDAADLDLVQYPVDLYPLDPGVDV